MSEFHLGILYGSGISVASMLVLWAIVGEIQEIREHRRAVREHREVLEDEGFIDLTEAEARQVKIPRHSREASQDPTRRLIPPEDIDNPPVNRDDEPARPIHWPPPRGRGLPWRAHDDQCAEETLWPPQT